MSLEKLKKTTPVDEERISHINNEVLNDVKPHIDIQN
jgi:hypothetical protein